MIGASAWWPSPTSPGTAPSAPARWGYVDGKIVINPTREQRAASQMDTTVASTGEKVVMIEAGANEIPDEIMFEGIKAAHEVNKTIVALINRMVEEIGKPKFTYQHADFNRSSSTRSWKPPWKRPRLPWTPMTRNVREERWNKLIDHWHELFLEGLSRHGQVSGDHHLQVPEEDRQGLAAGGPPGGWPQEQRDPAPGGRGGRAAPGPRLRPVHPRPDPGAEHCHPEHPLRRPEAGHHLGRGVQAVYAPLQHARLLHRRGPGRQEHQPPGVRPRRPG